MDAQHVLANIQLGNIFRDLADAIDAQKYYERALELDPNNVDAQLGIRQLN